MIHFQYELEGKHLNNSEMAYDEGFMEGDVWIYIDGECFFEEQPVNVVELGFQLGKWLDAAKQGVIRDFQYDTIDHDEPILIFNKKEDGIHISSPWQSFEPKPQPVADVQAAVTTYLVSLNEKLHAINYVLKLDRFLHNTISDNAKALMLFEQNEYREAFNLFQMLAKEQPNIQSMNNLSYMYLREEEVVSTALKLLQQVIAMQPKSHFPYNMLAEIYLQEQQYEAVIQTLQKSLQIQHSEQAVHNLGIAYFKLERYDEAIQCFRQQNDLENVAWLYEIYAYVKSNQSTKALERLATWTPEWEAYVSETEIADLYLELGELERALAMMEGEWKETSTHPYLLSRYAYLLYSVSKIQACRDLLNRQLQLKQSDFEKVQQEETEENWTESDKQETLDDIFQEIKLIEQLETSLQQGYVPKFTYDLYPLEGCYLFGCQQHGHNEYEEGK